MNGLDFPFTLFVVLIIMIIKRSAQGTLTKRGRVAIRKQGSCRQSVKGFLERKGYFHEEKVIPVGRIDDDAGSMAGLAEEAKQGPTEAELLAKPCEFSLIEANGEQPRLTYIEGVTPILEVDGYKFKDMNKNGQLDPYEDWRLDTETA